MLSPLSERVVNPQWHLNSMLVGLDELPHLAQPLRWMFRPRSEMDTKPQTQMKSEELSFGTLAGGDLTVAVPELSFVQVLR